MKTRKAFLMFFVLLSTLACQFLAKEEVDPPSEKYLGLRNTWLTLNPDEVGIDYEPGSNVPYAVIMDIGISGGVVTIASSILGDGSMLTGAGGGIFGGIGHENVRNASIKFVQVSADFVSKMTITTDYPLPSGDNKVRFYVITPNGVYTSSEMNPDILAQGNQEFSPLFLAGDDVITELRLVSENQ